MRGPEHSDTAASLGSLARLLREQKRFSEAEPLYRRLVSALSAAAGADHPDVATALGNLGGVLRSLGDLPAAETAYRRSLGIREAYGRPETNPDVALDLGILARVVREQGRLADAEPLYLRSLETLVRVYGPGHEDVEIARGNLEGLVRELEKGSGGGGGSGSGGVPSGGGRGDTLGEGSAGGKKQGIGGKADGKSAKVPASGSAKNSNGKLVSAKGPPSVEEGGIKAIGRAQVAGKTVGKKPGEADSSGSKSAQARVPTSGKAAKTQTARK